MRVLTLTAPVVASTLFLVSHVSAQQSWGQISTNTPPNLIDHGISYFETGTTRRILLHGGHSSRPTSETWYLDTLANTWTQLSPTTNPPKRWQISMVYDSQRKRVVLFGGRYLNNTFRNDTWEFDGMNWIAINPATKPPGRSYHRMAYDAARNQVVLFGGRNLTQTFNDTWVYNGINWQQRNPTTKPSAREDHAMSYDTQRQRVVMTGGQPSNNETWEWDGINWSRRANMPTSDSDHGQAYDTKRMRTVVWRSRSPYRTYEWNGASWATISTTTQPKCFVSVVIGAKGNDLAYDVGRGASVFVVMGQCSSSWVYGPAAELTSYGTSCVGSNMLTPQLAGKTATDLPRIGRTMTLAASNLQAAGGQGVILHLGLSDTVWGTIPLPFDMTGIGAPGCFVRASGEVSASTVSASGSVDFPIPFPADPNLVGANVYFQSLITDPINTLGLITTNGLRAKVGH